MSLGEGQHQESQSNLAQAYPQAFARTLDMPASTINLVPLLALGANEGEPLTATELVHALREAQGDPPEWEVRPERDSTTFIHALGSLAQAGYVDLRTASSGRQEATLTPLGATAGLAHAGALLDQQLRYPETKLSKVFGWAHANRPKTSETGGEPDNESGDQSRQVSSPSLRMDILGFAIENGPAPMRDLLAALPSRPATQVTRAAQLLREEGILRPAVRGPASRELIVASEMPEVRGIAGKEPNEMSLAIVAAAKSLQEAEVTRINGLDFLGLLQWNNPDLGITWQRLWKYISRNPHPAVSVHDQVVSNVAVHSHHQLAIENLVNESNSLKLGEREFVRQAIRRAGELWGDETAMARLMAIAKPNRRRD